MSLTKDGNERPVVVVAEPLDQECLAWLSLRARVVRCLSHSDEFLDALKRAEGLIVRTYTRVAQPLLEAAPLLRVVGRGGAGLENIHIEDCRRRCVRVVYTPEANTQAVAEYVMALILDAMRPRVELTGPVDGEEFHRMRREHVGQQLDQMTLGILGFGRVGRRLGRIAHAVGMKLLVNDLLPESALRQATQGMAIDFDVVDKATLYHESDVVSVHVDGRPDNGRLIDHKAFAQMNPRCLLINTSRGLVIHPPALARWAKAAAREGGQAVLDVHQPEPPPADYPLYDQPNIRLLPHLASRTDLAMKNMSWVVRDVVAVLEGQEPQYPAD